jgi:hypothetical protein
VVWQDEFPLREEQLMVDWQPTVPQFQEVNVHLWVNVQDCPGLKGGQLSLKVVQPFQPYQPQLPMVWQTVPPVKQALPVLVTVQVKVQVWPHFT